MVLQIAHGGKDLRCARRRDVLGHFLDARKPIEGLYLVDVPIRLHVAHDETVLVYIVVERYDALAPIRPACRQQRLVVLLERHRVQPGLAVFVIFSPTEHLHRPLFAEPVEHIELDFDKRAIVGGFVNGGDNIGPVSGDDTFGKRVVASA